MPSRNSLAHLALALAAAAVPAHVVAAQAPPTETGEVLEIRFEARSLAANLLEIPDTARALVYVPPSYDRAPNRSYPVLYLLHAFGVGPESWRGRNGYEGMEIGAVMDSLVAVHDVEEMVVVMPDARTPYGGSWYGSSPAIGDWETLIAVELVEFVDGTFRTVPSPEARAVAGQSMGGYGALRIASAAPNVFGTVVAISGPSLVEANPLGDAALEAALAVSSPDSVLAGSPLPAVIWSKAAAFSADPAAGPFFAKLPVTRDGAGTRDDSLVSKVWRGNTIAGLLEDPVRRRALAGSEVRLDVGTDDPLRGETIALADELASFEIDHSVVEFTGGHVEGVRAHVTGSVLPYVSARFRAAIRDR